LGGDRLAEVERRRSAAAAALRRLAGLSVHGTPALEHLCRPDATLDDVADAALPADPATRRLVETEARYAPHVVRERARVERGRRMVEMRLPPDLDLAETPGLRREAREQIARCRPARV